MKKSTIEIDPFNRLVINGAGGETDLPKFRKVLDGQFKVDENNNLSYHVKAPLSEDENIPHQFKISGSWRLTDSHKLLITLDQEARRTFGDELTLQAQAFDAGKDSLIFSMTTRTLDGESTYILNLQGFWKADENNRLSFYVRREGGKNDILTFNGAWDIGENNQLIYRYSKASLKRKKKETNELLFKGHWDIKEKFRISYLVGGSSDSSFDFESSAGILGEDYIKYEVGIGVERNAAPVKRIITLSGRWNLKKDTGLLFEIEYEGGEIYAIIFSADVALSDKDVVSFRLKSAVGNNDLGMTLELSREILAGDGELFLRALASNKELAVYAGAAWRW